MKLKALIFLVVLMPILTFAQMSFKSVGTAKPIELTLGWQDKNGAFAWYKGQKEPITLKFKSLQIDSDDVKNGQPYFYNYKYTEMYKGKATGEYGFTEWPRNVDDIYYIRHKDGKKFKFKLITEDLYDGKSMVLLNNVQFHYYSFYKDSLTIVYPDGNKTKHILNELPEDKPRRVEIKDFNFDGVNDIAFDITSEDGLNVVYDVFIYNQTTKKYNKLQEPADVGCGYMINLKIDEKRKELITMCKSGAKWYSFTYKVSKLGKLILVKKE